MPPGCFSLFKREKNANRWCFHLLSEGSFFSLCVVRRKNILLILQLRAGGLPLLRAARTGFLLVCLFISPIPMNLLYADEAGVPNDSKQVFFILAGISLFERQTFWLTNELDQIAARFNPADPASIELHGSPMFTGRGLWRKIPMAERIQAIKDALTTLCNSHNSNTIFACIIRKSLFTDKDPMEVAFEQLASRFDYFLKRLHRAGNSQRGLIIFDKSAYETTIQSLTTHFRNIGHSWDVLRNLAEVPLFIDSKASRLIQLADLINYALFRYYEYKDDELFSIIRNRIDRIGGQVHGLYERI